MDTEITKSEPVTEVFGRKEYRCTTTPSKDCPYGICDGLGHLNWVCTKGYPYDLISYCDCWYKARIEERWTKTVGSHDQWVRLHMLVPSEKSALPPKAQQQCIDVMRADPDGNYCMFGPSGASKTTFTLALYRKCLLSHPGNYQNIIRIKTKTLLETIQAYRFDDNFRPEKHPPFTHAKKIRSLAANGTKTHLFLEELEKVKYTEHRANEIFDIVDAIYEEGGQLIITGNLTYEDLNDTNKFVEGFPRRIDAICGKHKWDFWQHAKEEK